MTFTLAFDEAGKNTIEVNELTDSLLVKEKEEPTQETGTIAEIPAQLTEGAASTSGSLWWIIGSIIAICVIVLGGVIFYNRRRDMSNRKGQSV